MAGVSYAFARWNRYWLLAVIFFLALNWLGDSLDGTLARVRRQQRPRYGFYVDHIVDSFGGLALMGGLALSGYMHPYIAIGTAGGIPAAFHPVLSGYIHVGRISALVLEFWPDRIADTVIDRQLGAVVSPDGLPRALPIV